MRGGSECISCITPRGRGGFRRGSRRRNTDGDDSNKENDRETGDDSGADGEGRETRGRRRNFRGNRRFRRGGRPSRNSESELTDEGGEAGQGDADDKPRRRLVT